MSTTLRDILDKLLGRQPASAKTARDRLQLVLAHDRSDLSPELLDQMRREIFEVVAKYVDIDLDEGEVSLETEDRMTALVANLPIKRCQAKKPSSSNESSLPPKEQKATLTPKQESPLPPKEQESLLPIKETE
ncbi:MAG: cell division topological specificity factor MinE [Prochlorococcus sp.]|jgi:cell division topological specificity factor|nr:cell division topological specificity factor MinE [Prochlorococcaceae cyanobacterium ETNP2_MAG_10]MDP6197085.1 cell division topological specificity factor MinE [Prochlorococcaceae cyanobacterium ETNP18_MAG_17]MDP6321605.1 cell division topological specificity factor MinE [Prochlorococcaceae cyanobacterium ETNP14_MAG_5]MDP6851249.1 cell division topological specificity factor MinE [Prochlorococcaceae cyanobacterium ETNP1_MAG_8]MDP7327391.1 cell division topological specificity factor MinE [P|tara:strand:- start:358 stop:756 length:399 start_codon:yes stop_codon:yes gene_type:complete